MSGSKSILFDLQCSVSPKGRIRFQRHKSDADLPAGASHFAEAFVKSAEDGILELALRGLDLDLSPQLHFFRNVARQVVTRVCQTTDPRAFDLGPWHDLPDEDISSWLLKIPPTDGADHFKAQDLGALMARLYGCLAERLRASAQTFADFVETQAPSWHTVGRVCLHLAENKKTHLCHSHFWRHL